MLELPQNILQHLSSPAFDHLMAMEGKVYRKQSKRQTEEIVLNGAHYFIKKHDGITLKECIKNLSMGRLPVVGAETEWKAIQALNKLGIATTPLVGYGKQGLSPFKQRSFVLTKALKNTESLEDFCKPWVVTPPPFLLKRNIITEVARMTRCLHQHHYYHRDLYLCHFLLEPNLDHPKLFLIDLHRMRKATLFNKRWQVKDLASLLFSSLDIGLTQRDIFRFLKVYTGKSLKELKEDEALWRQVERKSIELYKKAYGRLPSIKTNNTLDIPAGKLHIEEYLRVLPNTRWVFRATLNNESVVAKLFINKKDFQQELHGAKALAQHNIHTPALLHETMLENRYFIAVYQYLNNAQSVKDINEILITLFAQLHQSGLKQDDCHLDNFLEYQDQLYVLDSASIKVSQHPLDVKKSLDNLALLFAQKPHDEDRYRALFHHYLKQRDFGITDELDQHFLRLIEKHQKYRLRKWTKKIFRNCSAFKCKTRFDKSFCIDNKIENIYSQTLCEYPEAYFHPKAEFLKQGNSVTVVRTKLNEDDIVIKRYNLKDWKKASRRLITPSKAARAWKMGHILQAFEINVPKPLAFFERRIGPLRRQSYFVSEYCPGMRLDKFLEQSINEKELNTLANALFELMQKLKYSRCYHGDLKSLNFIWDGSTLWLLDFDGALLYESPARFETMHQKDWERLYRNWGDQHPLVQRLHHLQEQARG